MDDPGDRGRPALRPHEHARPPGGAEIAEEMGYEESARWVREHRDLYARAIFHGFEVEGGKENA